MADPVQTADTDRKCWVFFFKSMSIDFTIMMLAFKKEQHIITIFKWKYYTPFLPKQTFFLYLISSLD